MLNPGKNSAPVFIWANRDCTHSTILQQNQKDRPEGGAGRSRELYISVQDNLLYSSLYHT
jgi:hypothetical protein